MFLHTTTIAITIHGDSQKLLKKVLKVIEEAVSSWPGLSFSTLMHQQQIPPTVQPRREQNRRDQLMDKSTHKSTRLVDIKKQNKDLFCKLVKLLDRSPNDFRSFEVWAEVEDSKDAMHFLAQWSTKETGTLENLASL